MVAKSYNDEKITAQSAPSTPIQAKHVAKDALRIFILVKGTITVVTAAALDADVKNNTNKKVIHKNWASFTDYISQVNNTQVGNTKDNAVVLPMHNFLEDSNSYSKTSGSLFQYYRDEPALNYNSPIVDFGDDNTTNSFRFEEKITGQRGSDGTKNVEIMVPLKFLSNFWGTFEMPLINSEINLIST